MFQNRHVEGPKHAKLPIRRRLIAFAENVSGRGKGIWRDNAAAMETETEIPQRHRAQSPPAGLEGWGVGGGDEIPETVVSEA